MFARHNAVKLFMVYIAYLRLDILRNLLQRLTRSADDEHLL